MFTFSIVTENVWSMHLINTYANSSIIQQYNLAQNSVQLQRATSAQNMDTV